MIVLNEIKTKWDKGLEQIFWKYHTQDYWYKKSSIKNKLDYYDQAQLQPTDNPLRHITKQEFADILNTNYYQDTMKWLRSMAHKFEIGDYAYMIKTLRYDQKVSKDVFKLVTGIELNRLNNAQIKSIIDDHYGPKKA